VHYVYIFLCVIAFYLTFYRYCITRETALRALTEPCISCSLLEFMLHFYERVSDDDDDELMG